MPTLAEYQDWKNGLQASSVGASSVILSDAQTVNPDQFAGDIKLGKAFGLPAGIVAEGRDGFAAKLQAKKNETILKSSPLLSQWLGQEDNAKVAHDDLDNLSWFEKFGKQAKEAVKGVPGGVVSSAGTAMEGAGQLLTPRPASDSKPLAERIANAGDIQKWENLHEAAFARNQQFLREGVKPGDFTTTLAPDEEKKFRAWVKKNNVPFNPDAKGPQDYDMRGFWKGLEIGDTHATTGIDPNDGKLHFTDYWKTPYHESFSRESKFANPNAPEWNDQDQLVGSDGTVYFDDKNQSGSRAGLLATIKGKNTKTPDEISALRKEIFKQGVINPTMAQSVLSDVLSGDMTPDEAMQALEPAFGPMLSVASKNLQEAGQALQDDAANILPATPGMEDSLGRSVGSALGSFLTVLAAGMATGPVGAGVVAGLTGAGQLASDARKSGASEDTQTIAALYGILPGLTDVIPAERLINNPVTRTGVASLLRSIGFQTLLEGGQEGVQQVLQNVIAQNLYAPDRDMMDQVVQNFTTGGIVGALVEAGKQAVLTMLPGRYHHSTASALKSEETQVTAEKINQAAAASKLKPRIDGKFMDWVNSAVSGSPVENVYVPAEAMNTYFQGARIDPEDFIAELPGASMDEFRLALATGGDLKIPTGAYAAKIAGTEFDPFLRENMRFDPDAMTLTEAKEFNARAADALQEAYDESERLRLSDEELRSHEQEIYDTMVSRLRAAGRSTDVATNEAMIYPAFYRTMAERSGNTVEDLMRMFPLPEVTGARPEALQPKNVDEFTRALAELRSRKPVTDRRVSLLDFIAHNGGINDPGGELASRDAAIVRRGRRKLRLLRKPAERVAGLFGMQGETGHGFDDVARVAIDAGYLKDNPVANEYRNAVREGRQVPDIGRALLDAIDGELAGHPDYADEASAAVGRDRELNDIEDYLHRLGVSLDDSDETIRQAVEKDQAGEGRKYGQAARIDLTPGGGSKQFKSGDTTIDYGISRDGKTAEIILIKTPEHARGQGSARRALSELLSTLDGAGITTFLTAQPMDKGVDKAGLVKFYKSLGFRDNKGRKKDFRSQASMVRDPKRTLFQDMRGSISFPEAGTPLISLFEKANLSTFLHESGHYFLAVTQALAAQPGAPADIVAMYGTVKDWWKENAADVAKDAGNGVTAEDVIAAVDNGTAGDAAKDAAIDVGMQEQFARASEAYFMEGKAPNQELRSAFEKFRAWLLNLYKRVVNLGVNVNDEIRGVFDRMIASDAEIEKARSAVDDEMLFQTAAEAGLSEDQFKALAKLHDQAQDEAKQKLLKEAMAPIQREREKWFKEERAKTREEVERGINSQRTYRALEWIGNRRWLGEGQPQDMPDMRMSKDILVERYGEGVLKTLPRGKFTLYTVDGGMDPDEVAGWFGFASGDELVKSLETAPGRKEAIEAETDRLMRERHGDVLRDGSAEEKALAAVHGDKRGQYLAAELKTLKALAGDNSADLTMQDAREIARRTLNRMQVRDAVNSRRYLAAERRAADDVIRLSRISTRERINAQTARREVGTTARQGIRAEDTAALEKTNAAIDQANVPTERANDRSGELVKAARNRLVNHALYAESVKIAEEVAKAERFVAKLSKRSTRERLAGDYLEAIDEILDRYDFRKLSATAELRRGALLGYVQRMTEEGRANELAIPDYVIAEAKRTPYKRLSVEYLRGVVDTLRNIEHTARLKRKLVDAKNQRDLDAVVGDIVDAFGGNVKGKPPSRAKSGRNPGRSLGRSYLNLVKNADTILREVDGFKDGGATYRNIKAPLDEAHSELTVKRREAAEKFDELYSVYSKAERRNMAVLQDIPELGGQFSKWDLISIGLNLGNEGNFQRLTDRRVKGSFTPEQLDAAMKRLDARDADFIQSAWDMINSYWPEIEARERRVTGVAPEKVQNRTVTIGGEELRGGYYPLKYDSELSSIAYDDEAADLMQNMKGGRFGKAQTRNGHLKERGTSSGRPVMIDIGVLHGHINQVLHDLALSESVNNSWKILHDQRVKDTFINAGMLPEHQTLEIWLQDVATGEMRAGDVFNKLARRARSGFTVSRLAFNLSTVLLQPIGNVQSIVAVGKKNFALGVTDLFRYDANPWKSINSAAADVMEKSPFMRERQSTFQKDIYDILGDTRQGPAQGRVQTAMREVIAPMGFWMMQKAQFYSADLPTWFAGYRRAAAQGMTDEQAIAEADRAVARAQGSGVFSDRSAIERGSLSRDSRQKDVVRLFTALGSYMFAKFNVAYERTMQTDFRDPRAALIWASDMGMLFLVEAVLYEAVHGRLPGDDDDDESWPVFLAKQTALSVMQTLPGLRDLASAAQGFNGGGAYGSVMDTLAKPVIQAGQGELDRAFVKSIVDVTGMTLMLPSVQVNRFIDATWRANDGEDVSPAEYMMGRSH